MTAGGPIRLFPTGTLVALQCLLFDSSDYARYPLHVQEVDVGFSHLFSWSKEVEPASKEEGDDSPTLVANVIEDNVVSDNGMENGKQAQ